MKKIDVYDLLKSKLMGYLDYIEVPVQSVSEELLPIPFLNSLTARQIDPKMRSSTGDSVYVRKSVLEKLLKINEILAEQYPLLKLEVVSGYRTFEIQTRLFEAEKAKLEGKLQGNELLEAVHKYIAFPDVAGHPTGGAVDVHVISEGQPLDFGTPIWSFTDDSLTFSPFITKEAWSNRHFLRRLMMSEGFAPFDGEWWHFSYGDKEWAKYYDKKCAIYEQIHFKSVAGG